VVVLVGEERGRKYIGPVRQGVLGSIWAWAAGASRYWMPAVFASSSSSLHYDVDIAAWLWPTNSNRQDIMLSEMSSRLCNGVRQASSYILE
jgi:hypothetical protein